MRRQYHEHLFLWTQQPWPNWSYRTCNTPPPSANGGSAESSSYASTSGPSCSSGSTTSPTAESSGGSRIMLPPTVLQLGGGGPVALPRSRQDRGIPLPSSTRNPATSHQCHRLLGYPAGIC